MTPVLIGNLMILPRMIINPAKGQDPFMGLALVTPIFDEEESRNKLGWIEGILKIFTSTVHYIILACISCCVSGFLFNNL